MKKIFKRVLKILRISLMAIVVLIILFLLACFVNNQIQLRNDAKIIKPTGKIVQVDGRNMHVYSEGQGDLTCVFMSGSGICASDLEFKGLYKKMSDEYRIAVVDRAGYGFSKGSNDSRDIDTILDETRKALSLAGEKAPYVLFPHSISGIEAIYWAQKYPEEIKAIIGLDIGFPEAYVEEGIKKSDLLILKAQAFLTKCGVHRLFPSLALNKTLLDSNFLSGNEKKLYEALVYKNFLSKDVVNELSSSDSNSKKSLALKLPTKTPLRIFIATKLNDVENTKGKYNFFNDYAQKFDNGKIISIVGKHCIYLYNPETIAKESKAFIKSITTK